MAQNLYSKPEDSKTARQTIHIYFWYAPYGCPGNGIFIFQTIEKFFHSYQRGIDS